MNDELVLYLDAKAEFKGNVLLQLAEKHNMKTFVETGTYSGEMVKYMNDNYKFSRIYSIELSLRLYARAFKLFQDQQHITILQGDSGEQLRHLDLRKPALFWLDAHYSCGCTARGKKITPILEELDAILSPIDHVIVIDDLDNLPKWSVPVAVLKKYIWNRKPQVEFTIVDTMLIVGPCAYGGI